LLRSTTWDTRCTTEVDVKDMSKLVACAMTVLSLTLTTDEASATSCGVFLNDVLTLRLERVSVDGAPLTDTSAYDGFTVTVEGGYVGNGSFTMIAATEDHATWVQQYR
jgi:hypothetical protein